MAGSEYYDSWVCEFCGRSYNHFYYKVCGCSESVEFERLKEERQETRKKATSDLMALLNLVDYKFEGIGVKTEKGWICLRD